MDKVNDTTYRREVKNNPNDRIEVEIGDSKQPDFKPQFKLMRWDNEVNFSMRAEEHPDAVLEEEGGIVKYKTPKYEVHQYEKPEAGEDGGFEFEWVLNEKPDTNVLIATIQTKELDFFYQPELTPEEVADGATRPENVVGSYAVYHRTGRNNRVGGKAYRAGKAFHIYRPFAEDASGAKVWCELNIVDDVMRVVVPQEFLDAAVYPVRVDPTFGYTSIGASESSRNGNNKGSVFTSPAEDGDITKNTIYCRNSLVGVDVDSRIYAGSAGDANSLLASSSSAGAAGTSASWVDVPIAYSFVASTSYWLVGDGAGGASLSVYYDAGDTDQGLDSGSGDPLTGETYNTRKYSIYATYTVPTSGPANLKTYNTNPIANVKTINTNPIANVKSLNTNT